MTMECKFEGCEQGNYCFGFHQALDEYGNWNGDGEYEWGACPCCKGVDWKDCPRCNAEERIHE